MIGSWKSRLITSKWVITETLNPYLLLLPEWDHHFAIWGVT